MGLGMKSRNNIDDAPGISESSGRSEAIGWSLVGGFSFIGASVTKSFASAGLFVLGCFASIYSFGIIYDGFSTKGNRARDGNVDGSPLIGESPNADSATVSDRSRNWEENLTRKKMKTDSVQVIGR